jgi:dipeptidase E
LIGVIKAAIKHREAKTMLLTSGGMLQMQDEIIKLLQKPAYDVTVGFINTARKYRLEDDPGFVDQDLQIMKNIGFNVETIDIDGKKEHEVAKLLETKDIVFVGGGNTFYLLKAMRACNFEKILRRLMKNGKVYIGVSAGSIVAGKTIKTAGWKNADKNIVGLKNLKGLHLVPFDIFVHYTPEWEETIKKEMPNQKKRAKTLKIITDEQAILVQGREVDLIGDGEAIII